MVNNTEIIKLIKKRIPPKERKNIRAVVMREPDGYYTYVMLSYSGGDGMGYMGAKTFLDVKYKNQYSAQKLVDLINRTFKT